MCKCNDCNRIFENDCECDECDQANHIHGKFLDDRCSDEYEEMMHQSLGDCSYYDYFAQEAQEAQSDQEAQEAQSDREAQEALRILTSSILSAIMA